MDFQDQLFRQVWDTYAHMMNSDTMYTLLERRTSVAQQAFYELTTRFMTVLTVEKRHLAKLPEHLLHAICDEFVYAMQTGYSIRLVKELVVEGEVLDTTEVHLDHDKFVDTVFKYSDHYEPTPFEVALCEFLRQTNVRIMRSEDKLPSSVIDSIEGDILLATLYGCAASAIEERWG